MISLVHFSTHTLSEKVLLQAPVQIPLSQRDGPALSLAEGVGSESMAQATANFYQGGHHG